MKKYALLVLTILLLVPAYAQEESGFTEPDEFTLMNDSFNETREAAQGYADLSAEEQQEEQYDLVDSSEDDFQFSKPAKVFTFERQRFEFGSDYGGGLDNDLIGLRDFFRKDIVIDLDKIADLVGDDGFNLNLGLGGNYFLNIKNIRIKEGTWDFGLFFGAEGSINFNMPQSFFALVSQGNIKQHTFKGLISASGGVYANAGLRTSAKYGNLRLGVKPVLFMPLIFIPRSGIEYYLDTEDNITLTAPGEITIYSPIIDAIEGRGFSPQFGFDLSFESEYNLFPFLDVGGSLSKVPFAPANMQKRTQYKMTGVEFGPITGKDILNGDTIEAPNFDEIDFKPFYDIAPHKVFRPMQFDVYARYKPFSTEILAIVPNIGFSVDINDKQGYFNGGLELQLNAMNLFYLHLGTGCTESIWKHRLGFALNLRAFEFGLEVMLRSQDFVGSFKAQGFGLNMGIRFGW